jgi:hypothetical protein
VTSQLRALHLHGGLDSSRRLAMKKDDKEKAPRKGKKPFFARLLEAQELEQVAGGGCDPQTKKFPSDTDEGGGGPVTLKYPSDKDDGGGAVTQKFPSDNEDGGAY